ITSALETISMSDDDKAVSQFVTEYINPGLASWAAFDRERPQPKLILPTDLDAVASEMLYLRQTGCAYTSSYIILPLKHGGIAADALKALRGPWPSADWERFSRELYGRLKGD